MRKFLAYLIIILAYPLVKLLQMNAKAAVWLFKKVFDETDKIILYLPV